MIDFQALIKKHDLTDYQEQLHRIAKTMIRIAAERTSDSNIKVGASKMGGDPDLPMKFEWPTWKEEPLSFLVQLNLTEINIFQASLFAAREGMLYFFIDTELNAFEEGSGRVMYSNSQAQQLQRNRNPASKSISDKEGVKYRTEADMAGFIPVGESYNPCRLTFTEELSLPDGHSPTVWGSVFGKDQAFNDDYFTWKRQENPHWQNDTTGEAKEFTLERVAEFKKYHSLEVKYFDLNDDWVRQGKFLWEMAPRGEEYYDHHLFGYSQPVECEPELLPGDQLLLQLDTHSAPAWEWGDMGKLYFWILDVDLAKNEFRDVQLDIQMG